MEHEDEPIEKVSYTDILPTSKAKSLHTIQKQADKPTGALMNVSLHTSKAAIAGPVQKDLMGDEAFTFEKSKLQQLHIEGTPIVDVNDESISKLKKDIFERFQSILANFDKMSGITRVLAVILLFIDILEMIGMFFMLLYLSLRMVPSEHILLWVGSALVICLLQMFLLIKAITASQSKFTKQHKEYLLLAGAFFMVSLFVVAVCAGTIIFGYEIFTQHLKRDAKATLRFAQKIIFASTLVKVVFQIVFFVLEGLQIKNLKMMAGDVNPHTDPISQRPVLMNDSLNVLSKQG